MTPGDAATVELLVSFGPDEQDMVHTIHHQTFKNGSQTYFNSSRFFPPVIRDDVYVLYGFVRTADNFVDSIPQDPVGFYGFVERYRRALSGEPVDDPILDSFVELSNRKGFPQSWTDAFLHSMELDLTKSVHATLPEMLEYVYGSAEVIGLYMARILNLPEETYQPARLLGRAMQVINFIRDIHEDNSLGRIYLPIAESSLPDLTQTTAHRHPDEFRRFVREQLARYYEWQAAAEAGYAGIPRRYRAPIRTAGDMYKWTGRVIADDPYVVFRRKVKPSKQRIVARGLRNLLDPTR